MRRLTIARWWALLGIVLGAGAGGCHTYRPLLLAPTAGAVVSFDVTDSGRVRLGPMVGEGARRIEGVVESTTDRDYVLRMRSVTYDNGQVHGWAGERLAVGREDVRTARVREFSRGRTAALTAASIGGTVALVVTRSLLVSGGGDPARGGPQPPPPID